MSDNVYEDFIKSKGLTNEFEKFEEEWTKADEAKRVDYSWEIEYMLGDADGNETFEIQYKAEERDNWIKYLKALGTGVEMITVEDEFRPGTRFFSEQLLKVFNCIDDDKVGEVCCPDESSNSLSTMWVTPEKIYAIDPLDWDGDDYEMTDTFNEIYATQVKPWIEAGANPKTAFDFYKCLTQYAH